MGVCWIFPNILSSDSDLRDVGIRGLRIPYNTVEKHIKDNPNKITAAAYSLFNEWLFSQENAAEARINMNRALDATGKPFYKQFFS